jgi:FtsP/CotA-like multicopper oxidase with cupredoxin domain
MLPRMTIRHGVLAIFMTSAACGSEPAAPPGPGPDPDPGREGLTDLNPDPAIVEVKLIAEPGTIEYLAGKPADVWMFRDASGAGSIPGPMLEANLGDHVIVHFENRLPDATTIHWHGMRVPNASDGTPVAQLMIAPGGTYDYEFDANDAGLFWYHPHVDGDVQIERGLYAPIRIRGGVEPDVAADRVFVLDDVKLDATGKLSTVTDNLDIMYGRQGNLLLVNGRASSTLEVAAGTRERWRFVNTANGRYFNLELPGHTFLVTGWDGGMLPTPYQANTLLIAPGERYEVLVEVSADTTLRNAPYDRGHHIPSSGTQDLVTVHLGSPGRPMEPLPDRWGEVTPIAVDGTTPRKRFELSEDMHNLGEPKFSINNEMYPNVTPVSGRPDDVVIWELVNMTSMDHPFHLHGMSFQILDDAGLTVPRAGWKDTVNVPQFRTVRFAVKYGPPGRWMYHCHILEHAERGMMGELAIAAP